MDQKVEIKEEPFWREGTASTLFVHYELSEKTLVKEELADAEQTQLCADVKDEILVEEHSVPCFTEDNMVENVAAFTRCPKGARDSCCNLLKTQSEQVWHLQTLSQQPYCGDVCYQQPLRESVHRKQCNTMSPPEADLQSIVPPFGEQQYQYDVSGENSSLQPEQKSSTVARSTQGPHLCTECGKSLSTRSHLKTHMLTHTKERPFECTECSRAFSRKYNFTAHMFTHTGEKNHQCNICGRNFSQASKLKLHELIHCNKRPYRCVECLKTFALKARLTAHLIRHAKPAYICDECGKEFSHKYHMKRHLLIHSGIRSYLCDECGRTFSQGSQLKIHKRTHSGGQPFLCHQCGLLFCVKSGQGAEWQNGCDHRRHLLIPSV